MKDKEIFFIENEYDNDTYIRLYDFYISTIQKPNMIILLIFYILSVIAFLYGLIILNADLKSYVIVEGVFTAFVIIAYGFPRLRREINKKFIYSKHHKYNKKQQFYFYAEHLIVKEGNIEAKYRYFKIYRVYETDDDFFLRIDKNITLIIPKNKISNIAKFEEFIEKKFLNKFINKYNKNSNGGIK